MGQFKIEIIAVGGHGVDRDKKDGEEVDFFESGTLTPDAEAKLAVQHLQQQGCNIESATITHWPGEESEVVDDLLTGKRKGNF